MEEQVSTKTLLTYGYFTRDLSKIVTQDSNIKIEDMCAYASFDAGIASLDMYCIPLPTDAETYSINAKDDQHLRNEWLRLAIDSDNISGLTEKLIHMWSGMHGPLTVIKTIPLAGYYVFERGTETGRETKGRGALAFLDSVEYESPQMTHERLKLAATIISRFVPNTTVQFYSPISCKKEMVRAPSTTSDNPMNIITAAVMQIGCKINGTGLRERIQSPEAHDLAMYHAWKNFIIDEAQGGVLDLNEWQIRNAISIISEFTNFLQPKYEVLLSTADGISSIDINILRNNIKAAGVLNAFHNENKKIKWLPLAAHWRMASKTGDWTLTVLPDYNRVEYEMSRAKLNLGGWGVNILYPIGTGNHMSMVYPDYATDPVIKTYYRTTRPWYQMVSVDEAFIDPAVVLKGSKQEEEYIRNFNEARLAITDMLSSKAFIRGVKTFRDPNDKSLISKITGNGGCPPIPDNSVIAKATAAIVPILRAGMNVTFDYVIPMNGQVMDSLGEIKGRRMIAGYAINIVQNNNNETMKSPVVALRWDDRVKRFLTYSYQEQEEDYGLGIYAR